MARFVLLRRLPRLGRFPDLYEPIVHEREYVKFPDLARDFSILDDQLSPLFIKLDNVALAQQNRFRLQQLTFLAGGTLVAILSALQTIITGPWLGIGQAVSALALAYVSIITRDDDSLERAVDCRSKAERLRSEYFLFLGRVGRYASDRDRVQALHEEIENIQNMRVER